MIDIAKIKELIALMTTNDLSEIEIHDDKQGVSIRRASRNDLPVVTCTTPSPVAPQPAPTPNATPGRTPGSGADLAGIESPMVGTCYLAPNPDAAPFVKVGQRVTPDTVVCLIEAMKVFNEIKAEKSGVIEQVLVKNGQAVEFGQRLFAIRPE
jgi:acetyl-CoA carboxylase biotin carboxyl carrier protein